MVMTRKTPDYRKILLCLVCFILTGCPGVGDRLQPDEQTVLRVIGDNVCLLIPDARDYQPANIAINLRGTSSQEQNITFSPALQVTDDMLCISPTFYHFPKQGQFIIKSVLTSKKYHNAPRKMVAGLAISEGRFTNLPLTDREILRPYSEISRL